MLSKIRRGPVGRAGWASRVRQGIVLVLVATLLSDSAALAATEPEAPSPPAPPSAPKASTFNPPLPDGRGTFSGTLEYSGDDLTDKRAVRTSWEASGEGSGSFVVDGRPWQGTFKWRIRAGVKESARGGRGTVEELELTGTPKEGEASLGDLSASATVKPETENSPAVEIGTFMRRGRTFQMELRFDAKSCTGKVCTEGPVVLHVGISLPRESYGACETCELRGSYVQAKSPVLANLTEDPARAQPSADGGGGPAPGGLLPRASSEPVPSTGTALYSGLWTWGSGWYVSGGWVSGTLKVGDTTYSGAFLQCYWACFGGDTTAGSSDQLDPFFGYGSGPAWFGEVYGTVSSLDGESSADMWISGGTGTWQREQDVWHVAVDFTVEICDWATWECEAEPAKFETTFAFDHFGFSGSGAYVQDSSASIAPPKLPGGGVSDFLCNRP